jgi:hypothetical protein
MVNMSKYPSEAEYCAEVPVYMYSKPGRFGTLEVWNPGNF